MAGIGEISLSNMLSGYQHPECAAEQSIGAIGSITQVVCACRCIRVERDMQNGYEFQCRVVSHLTVSNKLKGSGSEKYSIRYSGVRIGRFYIF
jgi:hypothetical protein